MAAVLNALVPFLINMIKDIPEEEVRMLLGASREIEKLGDKVGMMEAYLADAERRRINDASVQRWVNKLKGCMYDATDVLELCQLEAEERQHNRGFWASMKEKAPGCLRPLLFCLGNPASAHHLGRRIKELNARLDEIRKEIVDFGFVKLDPYQQRTAPSNATLPSRMTTSFLDESTIVGDAIKKDTEALVQVLLDTAPEIKVVSIVGAGGVGKTTLAKKIFNDKTIQSEFRCKIWLSVTESYNEEKLLSSAINQAGGEPRGDKQVLAQILAGKLSTNKFLLVLDDVWSDRPWTVVLQEPVVYAAHKQPGTRVIITSRNEDIVRQMGAAYHLHHVESICDDDAWSLLKKQLLVQDVGSESALDQLKHIGMGIIRRCDGSPLAIKAVGGLLRTKTPNEREWKGVLDDPMWLTDKTHHDLNSALRLSYEDLSPPMKQCFLYYSLIPKGADMPADIVIEMWMSEGFLQVPADDVGTSKEAEDIGISFYRDLIARNLIEAEGSESRMHDVIRSFAQYMAKEEAFIIQPGQISHLISSKKFRRLSIDSTKFKLDPMVLPTWSSISGKQELLRSLIINGRIEFEPGTDSSSLSSFPSLRTLYVRHAESDRFVESLGKLKHLRFLYLQDTDISRLPNDIGNMKFLEHIHLKDCVNFAGNLPNSILKLGRLRDLCIDRWGVVNEFNVPKEFGRLTNLRTLPVFPVQVDGEWCSLQELGPLSRLRRLEIQGLEVVPSSSFAAKAKVQDKDQLRTLLLSCTKAKIIHHEGQIETQSTTEEVALDKSLADCQRVEEVFNELCPPHHLEILIMHDYIGLRPPSWMGASSVHFGSLTSLDMIGLPFCTHLPDGLCQLPRLEHLTISSALAIRRVGPEFLGHTGNSSLAMPSFPRLQTLGFETLPEWEEWGWDGEADEATDIAMPALHTLYIGSCKLGRLPAGLASSRRLALRKLTLEHVSSLTVMENFPSVVDLLVVSCPSLKIIRGFSMTQTVIIESCRSLEIIRGFPMAQTVIIESCPNLKIVSGFPSTHKFVIEFCPAIELLEAGHFRGEYSRFPQSFVLSGPSVIFSGSPIYRPFI